MSVTYPPAPVRTRRGASTPDRMVMALAIVAGLALASAVTSLLVIGQIRLAVQTIGRDSEPSVVAAQVLRAQLAGMDAEAIGDSLNDNAGAAGTSRGFRDHLAIIDDTLVAAARNITYGDAEAAPLRALGANLQRYMESLGETRWMARDNPWLAVQRVRWSSRLLNDFVMPHAVALEQANLEPLERQYDEYRASSIALAGIAFGAFAAFLVSLVGAQILLLRRTRRLVNVPLAAATVLTAVAMAAFGAATLAERADVRTAKLDAFDSIHALYGAKAIAQDLNAARSMWLLDSATRTESAARFAASTRALVAVNTADIKATGAVVDGLTRAVEIEQSGRPDDAIRAAPKLGGLLGTEIANITFGVEERRPATDAVVALLNYLEVDREIRRLEGAGRHVEAIALATSARQGGSVAAFAALDKALDATIAVNEAAFQRSIADAMRLLAWMPGGACATLALSVLLAAAGLWQRWREYR